MIIIPVVWLAPVQHALNAPPTTPSKTQAVWPAHQSMSNAIHAVQPEPVSAVTVALSSAPMPVSHAHRFTGASAIHVTQLNVIHVFLGTIWLEPSAFTQLGFVGMDSGMSWWKNAMTGTLIPMMAATRIARLSKILCVCMQISCFQEHHFVNTTTR
jgi:hypothetical protein